MKSLDTDVFIAMCEHFKLDHQHITYEQQLEITYIYLYLKEKYGNDLEVMFKTLIDKQKSMKIRGRRRSLYHLFSHYQIVSMTESQRYITNTLSPPQYSRTYEKYI